MDRLISRTDTLKSKERRRFLRDTLKSVLGAAAFAFTLKFDSAHAAITLLEDSDLSSLSKKMRHTQELAQKFPRAFARETAYSYDALEDLLVVCANTPDLTVDELVDTPFLGDFWDDIKKWPAIQMFRKNGLQPRMSEHLTPDKMAGFADGLNKPIHEGDGSYGSGCLLSSKSLKYEVAATAGHTADGIHLNSRNYRASGTDITYCEVTADSGAPVLRWREDRRDADIAFKPVVFTGVDPGPGSFGGGARGVPAIALPPSDILAHFVLNQNISNSAHSAQEWTEILKSSFIAVLPDNGLNYNIYKGMSGGPVMLGDEPVGFMHSAIQLVISTQNEDGTKGSKKVILGCFHGPEISTKRLLGFGADKDILTSI